MVCSAGERDPDSFTTLDSVWGRKEEKSEDERWMERREGVVLSSKEKQQLNNLCTQLKSRIWIQDPHLNNRNP